MNIVIMMIKNWKSKCQKFEKLCWSAGKIKGKY